MSGELNQIPENLGIPLIGPDLNGLRNRPIVLLSGTVPSSSRRQNRRNSKSRNKHCASYSSDSRYQMLKSRLRNRGSNG